MTADDLNASASAWIPTTKKRQCLLRHLGEDRPGHWFALPLTISEVFGNKTSFYVLFCFFKGTCAGSFEGMGVSLVEVRKRAGEEQRRGGRKRGGKERAGLKGL